MFVIATKNRWFQFRRPWSSTVEQCSPVVVADGARTKSLFYHSIESCSPQHRSIGDEGRRDLLVSSGLQEFADEKAGDESDCYK